MRGRWCNEAPASVIRVGDYECDRRCDDGFHHARACTGKAPHKGRVRRVLECSHWIIFCSINERVLAHPRLTGKENAMEYATLGNTGLLVSKLCFGTMTFGDGRGLFNSISTVGQAGADELVNTSIVGGINFFDTADNYTEGQSEKILGQSLKNLSIARQDVVIATKVYSRGGPGRNDIGASRGHIMDGVEASLRRLQTDHIDLYQIHGNDPVTPAEETLRALDTLVQQGKVRYIGCSNWQAWKIAKALGISEFKNLARFDTLQAYYSIADRDLERELFPLLESEKTGFAGGARSIPGLVSGTGFAIRPLEQGEDGHCMAVAQLEIRLQPLDDGSHFHAWGEFAVLRKPLFLRKRAKVGRTLARLRLNVGKI